MSSLLDRPALASALRPLRFHPQPEHQPPTPGRAVGATVLALGLSLLADWVLAALAVVVFPSTRGYVHFRFSDYAKLTTVGVLVACIGWPIVVRYCSSPRWLYRWLAVTVTAVLLLPDLAIWVQGEPGKAVLFLVLMHLAIAVVTYFSMVLVAPPRPDIASRSVATPKRSALP